MGFHAVNVLLHVAVALAFYALALQLLAAPTAADRGGAVRRPPIHTEAVTGIVGRAEILAALAALGSLLALARTRCLSRAIARPLAGVLADRVPVGVLCKESAFTTIGLVLVVHWRLAPADPFRRRVAVLAPYVVVGASYLALRLWVVGSIALPAPPGALDNPLAHVDTATRVRTAVVVLWEYLAMLLVPARLSADYSFNQILLQLSWASRASGSPAFSSSASPPQRWRCGAAGRRSPWRRRCSRSRSRSRRTSCSDRHDQAERLLYLPSAGACLAAGWLLALWAAARPRGAGLPSPRSWRCWPRAPGCGTTTGRTSARSTPPPCAWRRQRQGAPQPRRGAPARRRDDDAIAHYHRALTIYPDYAAAAFGIGHIATLRGDDETAMRWYLATLKHDNEFAKAHLQLGMIYQRRGNYPAAESAFTAGLATEPDNALLLVNLAAARLSQGNRWGAFRPPGWTTPRRRRTRARSSWSPRPGARSRWRCNETGRAIALNTAREAIRNRILYSILSSPADGRDLGGVRRRVHRRPGEVHEGLQPDERVALRRHHRRRPRRNLLHQELGKKTIVNILSKPVARWQFLVGKFLGLFSTLMVVVGCMAAGVVGAFAFFTGALDWDSSRRRRSPPRDHDRHRGRGVLLVARGHAVAGGMFTAATFVAGRSSGYLLYFLGDDLRRRCAPSRRASTGRCPGSITTPSRIRSCTARCCRPNTSPRWRARLRVRRGAVADQRRDVLETGVCLRHRDRVHRTPGPDETPTRPPLQGRGLALGGRGWGSVHLWPCVHLCRPRSIEPRASTQSAATHAGARTASSVRPCCSSRSASTCAPRPRRVSRAARGGARARFVPPTERDQRQGEVLGQSGIVGLERRRGAAVRLGTGVVARR